MKGALSGIKVLEIADEKGVYCGKLFADMGAELIKVEPPGGDATRKIPPFLNDGDCKEASNKSLFYRYMNTSKQSLVLDLTSASGLEKFKALALEADIIIESLTPGDMAAMGLGYKALKIDNPGMIMTSISGFGQTGPHRAYKNRDIVSAAMGGAMVVIGHEDDPPVMQAGGQANVMASTFAAVSSLIALRQRDQTGLGQHVDISSQESMLAVSSICGVGKWLDDGIIPKRFGTGLFSAVPSGTYACKDGSIYLIINRPSHWLTLSKWVNEVTGNQEVLDQMFEGPSSSRQPYRELLDIFISELTLQFTVEEFYRQGQARHLAVTPLSSASSISQDAHLNASGFFVQVQDNGENAIKFPGPPYRLSETPWQIANPAPALQETVSRPAWKSQSNSTGLASPQKSTQAIRPLEGLRVIEFTAGMAGPWIGRIMALCGADVIKIESKKYPDVTRHYVPPRQPELGIQTQLSPWFTDWNAGKRFVCLDLTKPEGSKLARDLIIQSDIVVDNNSIGVLKKLGLGFDVLRKMKPELVLLSSTGYGKQGPDAGYISWGPNIETLSGLASLSGYAHRSCTMTQFAYPDPLSALHGLFAILAALHHRQRSGRGQDISLSQLETCIACIGHLLLEVSANGSEPQKLGNASLQYAPQGCYPCKGDDRWCVISVAGNDEWQALCHSLGAEQWLSDPRFDSVDNRLLNREQLDALIAQMSIGYEAHDFMSMLQANGVAAGVTQNTEDQMRRDPHLQARHFFEEIPHLLKGVVTATGLPLGLSESVCRTSETGKDIGADNFDVFMGLLGLSEEEVNELIATAVIETA